MSKQVGAWVSSISEFHRDWSHIIWNEAMLHEVGFEVPVLKEELGTWAAVSNYIRLKLLLMFGGVYLDTDVEAVDSLDRLPLDEYENFAAEQDGGRICNAIMAAAPRNVWIDWQLANWNSYPPRDPASGVYLASAPPREIVTVIPQHYVYPFLYDTPREERRIHRETILIHHWLGSWQPFP